MKSTTVKMFSNGKVIIPKDVRDDLGWGTGVKLMLVAKESGVLLRTKAQVKKQSVKSLRGFLEYSGEVIPTEQLCKAVVCSDQ